MKERFKSFAEKLTSDEGITFLPSDVVLRDLRQNYSKSIKEFKDKPKKFSKKQKNS